MSAAFVVTSLGTVLRVHPEHKEPCKPLPLYLLIAFFGTGLAFGALMSMKDAQLSGSSRIFILAGPVRVVSVKGTLATDSWPSAKGDTLVQLSVREIGVSAGAVHGILKFPHNAPPLAVLIKKAGGISRKEALEQGSWLEAKGNPSSPRSRGTAPSSVHPPGNQVTTTVSNTGSLSGNQSVSPPGIKPARQSGNQSAEVPFLFVDEQHVRYSNPDSFIDRLRENARSWCRAALSSTGGESSGFVRALLLGMKEDLQSRESLAFKNAGCSHVLALSGQHLSILASLVSLLLKKPLGKRPAAWFSLVFALLFVWVAGASPSLLRSLLMVLISALLDRLDRVQSGVSVLSLTFILALALDPAAARSLSFTLSYLAIFGLAVLSPAYEYSLGKRLWPWLARPLAAGLAAQTATIPLLAASFGLVQGAGLPASILSGPLVLVITWGALLLAPVSFLFPAARPVTTLLADLPYRLLMLVMESAARFPPAILSSTLQVLFLCSVVVAMGLLVYARPYADARLRRPFIPALAPRGGRSRHVQAIRPEFPHQSSPA